MRVFTYIDLIISDQRRQRTDGPTDRWTNGLMDLPTNKRTDGPTDGGTKSLVSATKMKTLGLKLKATTKEHFD